MLKKLAVPAILAASALIFTAPANAQSGVKVGTLTCHVDSGWGFIFGSSKSIRCAFANGNGPAAHYSGSISKFGVDIGYSQSAVMVWGVVAPTTSMQPGSLAGDYGGVTASATVGAGVGANVLIGGFNKSFTLQPISIEGNTGLNVAGGIEGLSLTYQPGT